MQNQTMGEWEDTLDMTDVPEEEEVPDREYLFTLAEKLMGVPVMYDVDQGDVERLNRIAHAMPEPECKHDWEDGFNMLGPTLYCKKCGTFVQD